jgi:PadR family transcriptional regulator, regulatory protein PadR
MITVREALPVALDLLIVKTPDPLGPLHRFGIARRIQQVPEDALLLNQGTLYPALVRLEQGGAGFARNGLYRTTIGARFYSLTKASKKQLSVEAQSWERIASIITRRFQRRCEP